MPKMRESLLGIAHSPTGNFSGSPLGLMIQDNADSLRSAAQYAEFQIIQARHPHPDPYLKDLSSQDAESLPKGKKHLKEMHLYFGRDIVPKKDNHRIYHDPVILRRHALFEREGAMIRTLRDLGGHSLGEIQEVLLIYTSTLSTRHDGCVSQDNIARSVLIKVQDLVASNSDIRFSSTDLDRFAQEVAYHKAITRILEKSPELINEFLESSEYPNLSKEFKRVHLAGHRSPPTALAAAMLAGHYLLQFEGTPADTSPSQQFLSKPVEYHQTIGNFLLHSRSEKPPLPTSDRQQSIQKINELLTNKVVLTHLPDGWDSAPEDKPAFKAVLDKIYHDLDRLEDIPDYPEIKAVYEKIYGLLVTVTGAIIIPRLEREILNHKNEVAFLRKVNHKFPGFLVDPQGRFGLTETLIQNIILAQADTVAGPVYTASAWLNQSQGYFGPDGVPLPYLRPCPENVSWQDISSLLTQIFDGQPGKNKKESYQSQIDKIYHFAPQILRFLSSQNFAPLFAQRISSLTDEDIFAQKVLDRFGPITDQDVNIVNIFSVQGGLPFAQQFSQYRQVFEFIRGVETQLVLQRQDILKRTRHRLTGRWHNHNFSDSSPDNLLQAITQTLILGESWVQSHDHVTPTPINTHTLGQIRSTMEIVFGWDRRFMKYTRWKKYWNSFNNFMEVAIECACPMRESLTNSSTFQQW